MSALDDLRACAARIDAVLAEAATSRRKPDVWAAAVPVPLIMPQISLGMGRLSDEVAQIREAFVGALTDLHAESVAAQRLAGEQTRDNDLRRLAVELDQLRRDLPALAEAARFELLDVAREMRS